MVRRKEKRMNTYDIIAAIAHEASRHSNVREQLDRDVKSQAKVIEENERVYDNNMSIKYEAIFKLQDEAKTKDTEIARLKGIIDTRAEEKRVFDDKYFERLAKLYELLGMDMSEDLPFTRLVEAVKQSQATTKEREAEAKSYKELYNELKYVVTEGMSNPREATHNMVIDALKLLKLRKNNFQEIVEGIHVVLKKEYQNLMDDELVPAVKETIEGHNSSWDLSEEHRLKYDRLIALLKRKDKEWVASDSAQVILSEHRDNEAKLKAKRGK
jgi:hypothetical protein